MSFYSAWQPLDRLEDAHTALVFGFLRHAPVDAALRPWLSNTLGRDVAPEALTIDSFWPSYDSILEGQERTVPELVFNAQDSEGHLVVVVEAKRQPKGHELDQLVREAIDTAHTTNAQRLAMIMVGVDTGTPERLHAWQEAIQAELEHEGLYGVELELRYSSWAQLGNSIETASDSTIDLAVYAEDVLAQMRLHGLLGYKGAPMSEDLGDLTIANAFTLVNRTIKQARQFFLALTADSRFINLGLEPASGRSEMLRDGVSTALSRPEGRFVTTTLFSHFRKRAWPSGAGAFAAFYVVPENDEPGLEAGAYWAKTLTDIQYSFADAAHSERDELTSEALRDAHSPLLTESARYKQTEWLYEVRSWQPGDPDGDLGWQSMS